MLLRDARTKAELAQENGMSAFLSDAGAGPGRVNGRILAGEMSQVRSHNRRCGVEPLPAPERPAGSGEARRDLQASALEREFLRSAHQLREGGPSSSSTSAPPETAAPRKRQRVGAAGVVLDVAVAQEAEERQAAEDEELANPLLRPPPADPAKPKKPPKQLGGVAAGGAGGVDASASSFGRSRWENDEQVLWPSKGLRVRIVDEAGDFRSSHLRKGVVCRRSSATRTVDVELEGSGEVLRSVPQTVLETVVSKACATIEIVRGAHRGVTAPLLHRRAKDNVAVIRVIKGGQPCELELPLDDVCEFK